MKFGSSHENCYKDPSRGRVGGSVFVEKSDSSRSLKIPHCRSLGGRFRFSNDGEMINSSGISDYRFPFTLNYV